MAKLQLKKVAKVYEDSYKAVKNIDLDIEDKEFIVLVGPSGCGKSTTLRMIAGLEGISEGEMYIGDTLVNNIPPKERDIAMVFQSYALYPHMTVRDNIAFAMRMAGVNKQERYKRVDAVARSYNYLNYCIRSQELYQEVNAQRVALGRAMVRNPKVFLLDEPLSNLDAKLRVTMRSEIVSLHRKLQTTFVYVTHDQTEAMTMGTRIAVISVGNVEQFDTPANLYYNPDNVFVAEFIGSPQMNMLEGRLVKEAGDVFFTATDKKIYLPQELVDRIHVDIQGQEVLLGIRPENIHYQATAEDEDTVTVLAKNVEQIGSDTFVYFDLESAKRECAARFNPPRMVPIETEVHISLDLTRALLFDKESQQTILTARSLEGVL